MGFYPACFSSLWRGYSLRCCSPCESGADRTEIPSSSHLGRAFFFFFLNLIELDVFGAVSLPVDTMQTALLNYVFRLSAAD